MWEIRHILKEVHFHIIKIDQSYRMLLLQKITMLHMAHSFQDTHMGLNLFNMIIIQLQVDKIIMVKL